MAWQMWTPLLASSSRLGRPIGAPRVFYLKILVVRWVRAMVATHRQHLVGWKASGELIMRSSSLTKVGPDHIFYFLVFMLNDCRKCALPILNKSKVETAQNMFVLPKRNVMHATAIFNYSIIINPWQQSVYLAPEVEELCPGNRRQSNTLCAWGRGTSCHCILKALCAHTTIALKKQQLTQHWSHVQWLPVTYGARLEGKRLMSPLFWR